MNRRRLGRTLAGWGPLAGSAFLVACGRNDLGQSSPAASQATPPASAPTPSAVPQQRAPLPVDEVDPSEILQIGPPDIYPAIFEPEFMAIEEVQRLKLMNDAEPVLTYGHKDVWHAYSTLQLDNHEIVNDVVGGLPIAATW